MSKYGNNVLIVAAHPDDEVLGCGIAIQYHIARGDQVTVLIMTSDDKIRYNDPTKLYVDIKNAQTLLKFHYLDLRSYPDQGLDTIRLTELAQAIEAAIEKDFIEIVYTHHYGDVNKDHRLTYEATITACRPTPTCQVKELYAYWVPSSSEWMSYDDNNSFKPSFIIEATEDQLNNKIEAMKAYESELREYPHPRSIKGIRVTAEFFGMQFGKKLVEPFQQLYRRT